MGKTATEEPIGGVEDIEIDDQQQGIVRVVHNRTNPYTMIHQDVLENAALSWEARGMLAYLLGKPDNWTVRFTDLVRQSPAGPTKTRRIFNELQKAGHIKRERISTAHGHFDWTSTIYEVPVKQDDKPTICRKPIDGKPTNGKPTDITSIDLPITESDSLVSTQENRRPLAQPSKATLQNAVRAEVARHFVAKTNLQCPPSMNKLAKGRMWWSPIREICELAHWDVPLANRIVDDALNELAGLTVSDPNSIIKTARAVAARMPQKPPLEKPKVRKAVKLRDSNNQEIEAYVYVEDSR